MQITWGFGTFPLKINQESRSDHKGRYSPGNEMLCVLGFRFFPLPLPPGVISAHQSPGEWVPLPVLPSKANTRTFVKPSLFLKAQEVGLTKRGLSKHELGQAGFGSGGWAKNLFFFFLNSNLFTS